MSTVYSPFVFETSTTAGTGTFNLDGAATDFQAFMDVLTTGDRVCYSIEDGTGLGGFGGDGNWEEGIGTITDATPDTLTREIITGSSDVNGDKVNFTAGGNVRLVLGSQSHLGADFITGLALSLAADTDHDITAAIGACRDGSDEMEINLRAAITKRIDASWVVGTGNGGFFPGGAVANNTLYHFFVIFSEERQIVDAGWDTDDEAANRPAGYTSGRRLASMTTDGSANLPAIADFLARPFDFATRADMEAGSSVDTIVSPGRQHLHPSSAKGWANYDQTGTLTINASENVASVTDVAIGTSTVLWDTDFSSDNYALVGSCAQSGSRLFVDLSSQGSQTAASATIITSTEAGVLTDASLINVVAFGDH